ncbi:MAG TPA: nuclear transport factor 2 family protein [Pseudonocardiaceae bacterium]|nr:nuclear transport factor 2 family protein [Pseudonocardiaceae bacterium]
MARTAVEIVELIRQRLVAADMSGFADLFAEDGVFEYPFGVPGMPAVYQGRETIRRHVVDSRRDIKALLAIDDIVSTVHETSDPNVVITESDVLGTTLATGKSFRFRSGVSVVTVRDGEVVGFRDYMNVLGAAEITGGQGRLVRDAVASGE